MNLCVCVCVCVQGAGCLSEFDDLCSAGTEGGVCGAAAS